MTLETLISMTPITLAEATGGNPLMSFLPMILLVVGFWFLIIAPQRKKQKEHDKMISELKSGDEIITASGIYGTITSVKTDRIVVKIADNTRIEITKNSVGNKVTDTKDKEAKPA